MGVVGENIEKLTLCCENPTAVDSAVAVFVWSGFWLDHIVELDLGTVRWNSGPETRVSSG